MSALSQTSSVRNATGEHEHHLFGIRSGETGSRMARAHLCPRSPRALTPARAAVVRRELPGWVSPIDAQRKQEVVTCARSVIDALWPALKDAYMHEVLESCVRRYDAMQSASTTPYVCVQAAPIRDGFDRRSARKGRLQPGETIDAAEEREGGASSHLLQSRRVG